MNLQGAPELEDRPLAQSAFTVMLPRNTSGFVASLFMNRVASCLVLNSTHACVSAPAFAPAVSCCGPLAIAQENDGVRTGDDDAGSADHDE
jgi:hypothetical protein